MMKAKPGQKLCSSCNEVNGVRAFECKKCGEAFKMKRRRRGFKKKQVEDHTTHEFYIDGEKKRNIRWYKLGQYLANRMNKYYTNKDFNIAFFKLGFASEITTNFKIYI